MSFGTRRAKRTRGQLLLIAAITAIVLGTGAVVAAGASAYAAASRLTADLPDLDAPPPPVEQTTKIFAADGTLLADLYYDENRIWLPIAQMPRHLVDAVVAAEDQRFFGHRGVDFESIARALVADLKTGRIVEGGSTITQQYIKNLYGYKERTFRRKVREALLAYQLEQRYAKTKIMERYLNTIYLGQSAYGVEAASRMYFDKPARKVTLAEAAMLAGLIRSPNNNTPYVSKAQAIKRRNRVLDQMLVQGLITTAQAGKAKKTPLKVHPPRILKGKAPYFTEHVKQLLIDRYGADTVFKGGLRVYTTIDLRMQTLAERAAWETLDRPGDPSVALVAIEPKTGFIKAMVGGRDFERLRYNLATQGHRQAGSAFKPFVLAAALKEGHSMDERIESSPGSFKLPKGGRWNVSNATEGGGGGRISLYEAITHSVNAAFARLILDVGAAEVAGLAQSMGITTPLNDDPAIALGGMTRGVTPLEMASAYGTLATRGFRYPPVAIQMVKGASGRVMSRARPIGQPVLDGTVCALETEALENVIREGTGRRARIGRPAAGKTGTTQNYADAWFVGYTPQLVTSVWVGYPQGQKPMYDVHGRRVAGGTFPAEIWARFMNGALAGVPAQGFRGPAKNSLVSARICDVTNLLVSKYCPRPVTARFQVGRVPKEVCGAHTNPPTVSVPRVLGKPVGEATELLTKLGFVAVPTYIRSQTPLGTVIDQSPHSGQTAAYGSMVALRVSAGSGAASADQPPRATFTASTSSPRVGEVVTFDGTASSDADGPIAQWSWSFGDGEAGSGSRVLHAYRSSGQYQPVLTVYDSAGHAVSVLGPTISVRP